MSQAEGLTDAGLRTPRAAAVAGVVFSLLTLASFGLLWGAIPADPQASGGWLATNTAEVALALNLIPFAGIAFLWFIGVVRDRLGQREDRFFATVFLGSGLLFLGMLFVAAAVVGAMLVAFKDDPAAFEFDGVSFCEGAFVQPRQRLHGQDGRRIHDFHLDGCNVDSFRASLAGRARLSAGALAAARQSFLALEFRTVSALGPSVKHPYPGEQFWPRPEGLKIGWRRRASLVTLRLAARSAGIRFERFPTRRRTALGNQ